MNFFPRRITSNHQIVAIVVLIFGCVTTIICDVNNHGLVVQSKLGKILGSVMSTDQNNEFYAFQGIPFAQPPLGNLRFKAPVPANSWNGTLDGTHGAYDCLQHEYFNKSFIGDEDCLYLNVYTPALISYDNALPVMVFIHGGGFTSGSGSLTMYGPQRLLDKDVVLVTINYRVGALGFLSTGDVSSPGNYGLLDQVEALRWVQENIVSFGGDPNRVTIFGESAGSASVLFHMISPLSKGLFQGAIAQSGAPWSMWSYDPEPLKAAVILGDRLGCPTGCTTKLMECLKRQSAVEILISSTMSGTSYAPISTKPVADIKYGGSFLSDNPYVLFKYNKINHVPVMGGITKDEGAVFHLVFSTAAGDVRSINSSYLQNLVPIFFQSLEPGSDSSVKSIDYIKKNYFGTANSWQENFAAFSKFSGDSMISEDVDSALSFLVKHGVPTYAYKLTYRGKYSLTDFFPQAEEIQNELTKYTTHGDDLMYLFHCDYFKVHQLNSKDQEMAEIMLSLWTNFAKTGVPTLNDTENKHPAFHWEQPTTNHFKYLDLNLQPKMVDGNLTTNLWRQLYKEVVKKQIYSADKNHPVIEIPLGKLKGSILKSDKGADIFAFRGIPYAQPPVGIHRFQAPIPVTPWKGILDATEDVPSCIQWDFFSYQMAGKEDCLYANVYTPKLPSSENKEKLPVMVFIFGGGFLSGSAKSTFYGPQRLLDKGVILVTFHYRLGPLGFFSTGDEASPGNYGMLDQVMLLRGVNKYIESFGGDPNRVTIFGESAGSASVIFHLMSPLSKGLFHGAIAQSGSPASSWGTEPNPESAALKIAHQMDCPSNTNAELVRCLRNKSALELTYRTTQKDFEANTTKKYVYRLKPVVDKFAGENSFLPELPNKLLADGKLETVPIILGTTRDEGAMWFSYLKVLTTKKPDLVKPENMEELMDLMFPYKFTSKEESVKAAKKIREEFFDKNTDSGKNHDIKAFIQVLSEMELVYDVANDVELLAERGLKPFVYKLTYRGERSYTDVDKVSKMFLPKDLNTVSHLDDLQYLFHLGFFNSHNLSAEDHKMADVMLTLWTNFAKTKVPSLDGSEVEHKDFVWEPSSVEKPRYLDLTPTPKMTDGHLSERQTFWRTIFKETSKQL